MADGHELLSSPTNINFKLENVDINAVNLLKEKADLVFNGNRIIWTRDLRSLENFVENILGLTGKWKSVGGKARQFTNSNKDIIVTWYAGKLNSLTFNGKSGETLKKLLLNVLSSKSGKQINTDGAPLPNTITDESTKCKSLLCTSQNDDQVDTIGRVCIDKDTLKSDVSSLDELQNFIDQCFKEVSVLHRNCTDNLSFAQTIDSSTPLRSQADGKTYIMEKQFHMFKEKIESEISGLITKLSEQTRIIYENKQEICKLVSENLNLKSHVAKLEEKVSPENNSNTTVHLSVEKDVSITLLANNYKPFALRNDDHPKTVVGPTPSISQPSVTSVSHEADNQH
jgi:cell division protein FtsL